ncbi:UDP-N-acetylmuramoyl-L-alanyl-D-glutamate--2,6-diaminopimelate ligase [Aquibacillus saliphilus]|uniref:UDP-N-acetylmuramoyl-L-alanyl-D-glutamate--2, 6-diaminopimelate ligase n=1 Tax=Aquibacillus saliphilus TaxID=1909422 RepID=UPI001CF0CFE1|nr:UDP-N-acetylmuramoyl-L-alanyl-D-glutamate--2,6-diaminopimelate ligase [Aquibacillus saliphilus]
MNTSELISYFKIKEVVGVLPEKITGIHNDSRKVEQESMFICTRGFTVDGHDYYQQALDKGASVIVAEKHLDINPNEAALIIVKDTFKALAHLANKFYNYPSTKLNVFGVTGTNGKTTVTNLIYSLLTKTNEKAALAGTLGFEIEGEKSTSENTTCDVLTNQKLLDKAVRQGLDHVVMEVSSHGLSQGRLWGVDFDVVAFTNLSHDHLDYHDSMEQYGYVKGLLFAQLGQDLTKAKYLVLNQDDDWYRIFSYWSPFEVISYGLQTDADFKAVDIDYKINQTCFTLVTPQGIFNVETKLLGEFNIYNILAAMASLFAKGLSVDQMVNTLKDLPPVNGRMEKVDIAAPVTMYIDYAHTPDAIEKSINSVLPFKKEKLIFLVGTGGDRDKVKRPLMAEKASAADYVVLTINDPRYEDPNTILKDMEKGMLHENYVLIENREEAISHAITFSEPGDILIFAGKGQEDYQIVKNKKIAHSDLDTVKKHCLKKYTYKV